MVEFGKAVHVYVVKYGSIRSVHLHHRADVGAWLESFVNSGSSTISSLGGRHSAVSVIARLAVVDILAKSRTQLMAARIAVEDNFH